mmetsp:Transcript_25488/g.55427  ORF Transcript_25488/g.55427 Transcript_25488/m.55427 type:complete len:99 (+) Transcript_25488:1277-1573(+)
MHALLQKQGQWQGFAHALPNQAWSKQGGKYGRMDIEMDVMKQSTLMFGRPAACVRGQGAHWFLKGCLRLSIMKDSTSAVCTAMRTSPHLRVLFNLYAA